MNSPPSNPQAIAENRQKQREDLQNSLRTQGRITWQMALKQQETMKEDVTQGAAFFRAHTATRLLNPKDRRPPAMQNTAP